MRGMFGVHKNKVILVKHKGDRGVTSGRLSSASGGSSGLQTLHGSNGDGVGGSNQITLNRVHKQGAKPQYKLPMDKIRTKVAPIKQSKPQI